EIHIEVRQNRAFVFREIWPGPGGLPLGSQGRGLAVVKNRDGMVAAWMGMKRGCRIAVATAPGEPLVEPLRRWAVRLNVLHLPVRSCEPMLGRIFSAPLPLYKSPRPFFPADVRPRKTRPRFAGLVIQLIFGSLRIAGWFGSTRMTS